MLVIPKSKITLGSVRFFGENIGINGVTIEQSVDTIGTTAKVVIPRNFPRKNGKGILDYIKVGDKATIALGYNDAIHTEFEGYIARISDTTPITVELEDEWWQLKKQRLTKSWKAPTLNEVLQFVFSGYKVDNRVSCDLSGGFIINNATAYEVAKRLRDTYGFTLHIDATKKTVLAFFPYNFEGFHTHTYVFGTKDCTLLDELHSKQLAPNIVKNDLVFARKEDVALYITVKYTDRKGKHQQFQIGDKSAQASHRTLSLGPNITDEQEARRLAQAEIDRIAFDGYTGKITGFGTPRTQAGDAVKLIDPNNPEREGMYLIKVVTITYDLNGGFRRQNEIAYKIA